MITVNNYHDKIAKVDFSTMPEAIRKGHEFVKKVTSNGASWDNYHASDTIKKTIDTYFEKLAAHLKPTKQQGHKVNRFNKSSNEWEDAAKKPKKKAKSNGKTPDLYQPSMVERIPDEIRFIRRFVNMNGKTKTKDDILRFVNSLQKAILEKRIRKGSTHVEQIRFIQDTLIDAYNNMGKSITISLKPDTFEALKKAANDEKVMSSVGFIKRYINLNGKVGTKEKARLLLGQINRAYEQKKITDRDPYVVEIHEIKKNLEHFLSEKSAKALEIEKNALNGLQGIINGCSCQNLNGFDGAEATTAPMVMNSMDFADMQFDTLGLKGKWLQLIGDPSTNFSVMVYGKPKMGKSYLCVDFAGYLARNHGKVLYVAREEGLDKTLQDKLNDKDVKHPNLYVASTIPPSLTFYDFIFLDSVNRLGLKPEDLNRLRATYPEKSFVFIFQTTKDGKFRGANTFQHDVDSVIEVPEKGKAIQYGRFNQGGEMSIF
ncbi:MAG: hypothetical protein JSS82_13240 [Bacteroidetes bacterium]|nr:hypothetical protein [Bacteroidota bacterium]